MKKEDFFDLLEHVDNKYIEEALFDDLDDSRVEVRAGKAHITPMKIIAPIAACLAVVIGAGIVISNKDKLATTPASSGSVPASNSAQNGKPLLETEEDFIEHGKRIVSRESELIQQSETTWLTGKLDVDFDGEDELLIYPQIDGKTVPEVGVRVFRKTASGIEDLGAFGKDDDSIDLNDIRKDERADTENQYYYCFSHDDKDGLYEGIRFVSYSEENGTVNSDKHLMRVIDSRLNWHITEGGFENGMHLGADQAFIARIREFPDDIIEKFCEFNDDEIARCEKDALTRNGKLDLEELLTPRMWHVGEYDINFDGETELLISLYNFSNMKGVFVYDKNCEYLGSFETENGLCDPELLYSTVQGGERFWYYLGIEGSTGRHSGTYVTRLERESINKIIVENNSFSTERLKHCDIIWDKNSFNTEDHRVYWVGDKEVTEEEYREAGIYPAGCMGSHGFDLTDPDEWEYSSMFEDSQLRGKDIGQANIERPSRFETAD
ncbi:MAG: hypothetical protein K2J80_03285 [Oscillospiraceae bacterium]|nr:hypothetical protein [Oscillospiraceae bacterium]